VLRVLLDGVEVWRRPNGPADSTGPVVLALAPAEPGGRAVLSFEASGPARWNAVKLVAGDAFVDLDRIPNAKLTAAWRRYNPGP